MKRFVSSGAGLVLISASVRATGMVPDAPDTKETSDMSIRNTLQSMARSRTFRLLAGTAMALPLACALGSSPGQAEDRNPDFQLDNSLHRRIGAVYVRCRDCFWSDNLLYNSVVEPGQSFAIHIDSRHCHYDVQMRIGYDYERDFTWQDVNLCRVARMQVWYDRSQGMVTATYY
jgi:hypothetical protein